MTMINPFLMKSNIENQKRSKFMEFLSKICNYSQVEPYWLVFEGGVVWSLEDGYLVPG